MVFMSNFQPNYQHIVHAAQNKTPVRLPLYEHIIDISIMEQIRGERFGHLLSGNMRDKEEFFTRYNGFFKEMGYDVVSFECSTGAVYPESGALGGSRNGVITNRADFDKYPFYQVCDKFFDQYGDIYRALQNTMPEGMKAVGGPGNGIFECVQDIVGYTQLCYISVDDPELYRELFSKVSEVSFSIWQRFLEEFGDTYCLLRFGDDLGYKSQTLISTKDIKELIIPEYKKIVDLVHRYKKPFLLHSCGQITDIMEELITVAGIDAKHSNEDQIATFDFWTGTYGDAIGNFGGVDMDILCRHTPEEIKKYVLRVIKQNIDYKGIAIGSGNSIPSYVPVEGYLAMVDAVREYRGDFS